MNMEEEQNMKNQMVKKVEVRKKKMVFANLSTNSLYIHLMYVHLSPVINVPIK